MRRWIPGTIEIATSFVAATLFVLSCKSISVDASDRLGQVSCIASIEWRFLLFTLPLFAVLVIAARFRDGAAWPMTSRMVCAALAGLASATIAGGVLAMLHRTQFGLGGVGGDSGILIEWADRVKAGQGMESAIYPPLQVYLLAWMSQLFDMPSAYAIKVFQVVGIAALGPLAYAAWRLLFRPGAALLVGTISALPMLEAYRQYPLLTLVVLVPVLVKFLQILRRAGAESPARLLRCGVLFGLGIGLLFLLYSGWFQWSAPGFLVAGAIVFPWRTGWKKGALFSAVTLVVFGLVTFSYLTSVAHASAVKDDYVYFDATIEPMYIAMWRGGLPGTVGVWPPMGELGGVGLFTVVLALGLGAAVALGRNRTLVITVGSILAGTWLFRLWHAHKMWQTKLVQLYPRTTAELLYGFLILACFAVYLAVERARKRAADDSILRTPSGLIGAVVGLLLLVASSSSAMIDKYMPKEKWDEPGLLAWRALHSLPIEVNQLTGATIEVSSSLETDRWSAGGAIDHKLWRGYSSALGRHDDHEESLVITMPAVRLFKRVLIYPAMEGSPLELAIDVWDGSKFVERKRVTDFPQRFMWPQTISLDTTDGSEKIRIRATKLRKIGDDYVFRLAEVELYP